MLSFDIFLLGLMVISTLTSLVTEGVKKILVERGSSYNANTLAGIVAAILSVFIGVGYALASGIGFTTQLIVCLFALVFASWLCAMVGYDKVIEVLKKFKGTGK